MVELWWKKDMTDLTGLSRQHSTTRCFSQVCQHCKTPHVCKYCKGLNNDSSYPFITFEIVGRGIATTMWDMVESIYRSTMGFR